MVEYTKMDLLGAEPLDFNGLKIYKPTLREISVMGFREYNHQTATLTLSQLDIAKFLQDQRIGGAVPDPIDFLIDTASGSLPQFLEVNAAFFTFLKKPIEISAHAVTVLGGKGEENFILDNSNFGDFQATLLMINKMYDVEEEREIKSPNEKLKQKFIQARLKLREAKRLEREKNAKNGDGITLPDIITSLCACGVGYTMYNVWDLTIYQLYEAFERVQAKDKYDKEYAAILAGADPKKVKLKNWMI